MEKNIIIWLQSNSTKILDIYFIGYSHLVSWIGVIFFLLVIFLFVSKKFALVYGMGFSITILFNYALKTIIARPRPYVVYGEIVNKLNTIGHSFPSGHSVSTMFMVLMFFALFQQLKIQKKYNLFNKKLFKIASIVVSVLMLITTAFARMYLGQHYITDIIAGFIVGIVGFFITSIIYKKH